MAWGLWNKIKNGFRKAGKVIHDAAKVVNNKVIKPFKPIISNVANSINPTLGKVVDVGMKSVERFSDEGWDGVGKQAKESASQWANKRFKK